MSRRNFTGPSPLHLAKERLLIPELWKLRQWPGEPGRSCPCPYRTDKAASGSVFKDGLLFHDFATGETVDAPELLSKVERLDRAEACRLFITLAGICNGPPVPHSAPAHSVREERPRSKPELPPLAHLSQSNVARIVETRHITYDAVYLAREAGLAHACWWRGSRCWVITDSSRWVAQARRLDGDRFFLRNGGPEDPKAWTFKGGRAGWPVGIADAAGFPAIALVEGGPDLLAAFHFIAKQGRERVVTAVAMLGASARIVDDALPHFRGKRVRIFYHADPPKAGGRAPGIEAAFRWQFQLTAAGATVDTFDLSGLRMADGTPVNDLNDLTRCHPDDWQAEREELETMMRF